MAALTILFIIYAHGILYRYLLYVLQTPRGEGNVRHNNIILLLLYFVQRTVSTGNVRVMTT